MTINNNNVFVEMGTVLFCTVFLTQRVVGLLVLIWSSEWKHSQ